MAQVLCSLMKLSAGLTESHRPVLGAYCGGMTTFHKEPAAFEIFASPAALGHDRPLTLAVDCGGGALKSAVCDDSGRLLTDSRRLPVTYPFTPVDLVEAIVTLRDSATELGAVPDRVAVGVPGMIREGRVVYTPHYIRSAGPHTTALPELEAAWNGLDLASTLQERLGQPVRVVNDSEMHGAALISGRGLEVTLTFGTGLGSAHFLDGRLQAHLELSHAQFVVGATYDQYIGDHVRASIGDAAWSERVVEVVSALFPVFRWDALYVGGGNAHNLSPNALEALTQIGPSTRVVANMVALSGGAKIWA